MTGKNRDMKRKSIQKLLNVVSSHPQNSKEKNEVQVLCVMCIYVCVKYVSVCWCMYI